MDFSKCCAVATVDIRNAFYSARFIWYETDNGQKKYIVTGGVPQSSVLRFFGGILCVIEITSKAQRNQSKQAPGGPSTRKFHQASDNLELATVFLMSRRHTDMEQLVRLTEIRYFHSKHGYLLRKEV